MNLHDSPVTFEETNVRRRNAMPWWMLGGMLFALAFVLGWRSAGNDSRRQSRATGKPAA